MGGGDSWTIHWKRVVVVNLDYLTADTLVSSYLKASRCVWLNSASFDEHMASLMLIHVLF